MKLIPIKEESIEGRFWNIPIYVKSSWMALELNKKYGYTAVDKGDLVIDADFLCRDCPECGTATPADSSSWINDICPFCKKSVDQAYEENKDNFTPECDLDWFREPHTIEDLAWFPEKVGEAA